MALNAGASAGHYRQYADRAAFDVSEITISLWVYWVSAASNQRVIQRGGLGSNGEWSYGTTGGGSHFFGVFLGGSARVAGSGALPSTGAWMHIVGTYQVADANVRFYVNNSLITSTGVSSAMGTPTTAIRMFENTSGTQHADVRTAHFGFWSKLLTADERAALYAGAHPLSIRPTALVIADELDKSAVDLVGGVPTNTGANLVDVDGPPQLKYIAKAPRRGRKAAGGGGSSPLLLRLHNERLFTGGFA